MASSSEPAEALLSLAKVHLQAANIFIARAVRAIEREYRKGGNPVTHPPRRHSKAA